MTRKKNQKRSRKKRRKRKRKMPMTRDRRKKEKKTSTEWKIWIVNRRLNARWILMLRAMTVVTRRMRQGPGHS